MIGSLVTTSCSCQKCCSADYATPTPDNLPDQIAVEYSGVPSFFEPNWCSQWKTTAMDSTGTIDLYYSRYREADHLPLNWSGTLDRLVIDGVPTDEYFKFFPEGNRQTYELNGIDESRWHEIELFGTRITKVRKHTFTSKFEIVGVYVARMKVATTIASCRNNIDGSPEVVDSPGSAWFADIIIEIIPGTESGPNTTILQQQTTFSGGTNYSPETQSAGPGLPVPPIDVVVFSWEGGFGITQKQPAGITIALQNKKLNRYTSVRRLAVAGSVAGSQQVNTFQNVLLSAVAANLPGPQPTLLPLEDFLTSTAADSHKRKQYLVPVQIDPITCSASSEEFVSEYIDYRSTLDPANPEIIPYIAPSSLIRNNTDPLSISLTNNDMSLPYGLYKLNVLEEDNTRSTPCTLGADQRLCNPEDSCCAPSNFLGCPINIPCQTAVCAVLPECCNGQFGWDSICVKMARQTPECGCSDIPFCGNPTAGDCLTVHATPFCNDLGCCQTVCASQPSCCANNGTGWTQECVNTASFFCGGLGSGFTNNLLKNLPAFCNRSYYIGHENLYKIQSPFGGCHFSYSTCGFRYIFGQESSDVSDPDLGEEPFGRVVFVKTPLGDINYNCAYDFLKTPACMLTERPIESVFGSSYLPEIARIEYFDGTGNWNPDAQGAGNTSMPRCLNLSEGLTTGFIPLASWCLMPQTTFPKIRNLSSQGTANENGLGPGATVNNNGLFATSAVIRISPVSVPPVP
jgi:hypothetical protein